LGLTLAAFGRSAIYPETDEFVNHIWDFIIWAAASNVVQLCGFSSGWQIFKSF